MSKSNKSCNVLDKSLNCAGIVGAMRRNAGQTLEGYLPGCVEEGGGDLAFFLVISTKRSRAVRPLHGACLCSQNPLYLSGLKRPV